MRTDGRGGGGTCEGVGGGVFPIGWAIWMASITFNCWGVSSVAAVVWNIGLGGACFVFFSMIVFLIPKLSRKSWGWR